MCGFMFVLCLYFRLCYVHFVLLLLCSVLMLVDCAVCSTLLALLVAGASHPLGSLREPYGVIVRVPFERSKVAHGQIGYKLVFDDSKR